MIDLSIVILNYRTPDLLMECLAALQRHPLTVGVAETWAVSYTHLTLPTIYSV